MSPWNPGRSEELYNVPNWGGGDFTINPAGNVALRPDCTDSPAEVDLHHLLQQFRRRGVEPPIRPGAREKRAVWPHSSR